MYPPSGATNMWLLLHPIPVFCKILLNGITEGDDTDTTWTLTLTQRGMFCSYIVSLLYKVFTVDCSCITSYCNSLMAEFRSSRSFMLSFNPPFSNRRACNCNTESIFVSCYTMFLGSL